MAFVNQIKLQTSLYVACGIFRDLVVLVFAEHCSNFVRYDAITVRFATFSSMLLCDFISFPFLFFLFRHPHVLFCDRLACARYTSSKIVFGHGKRGEQQQNLTM